jgi:hypothetical protein
MDHFIIAKPCTAQRWATATKTGTNNTNHHQAIDALALLLDDRASPSNTAETITVAYENSIKANSSPTDLDKDVSAFYGRYLCDAIRAFDSACKCLIDLLVETSEQSDIKSADGSLTKHRNGSVYWRDLPGWTANFMDYGIREFLLETCSVPNTPQSSYM